ncbi:MAG: transporter substrate-binding domain-containing protein [Pseudomonadota bacterium]
MLRSFRCVRSLGLLPIGLVLLLGACGADPSTQGAGPEHTAAGPAEYRDLPEILASGYLRVAQQRWSGFDTLPSEGISISEYERLIEIFAQDLGLQVRWLEVDEFAGLLGSAEAGLVDVAIGNLTVTDTRRTRVRFSLPLSRSEDWLVGDPAGTRLGIPTNTSYLDTAAAAELEIDQLLPDWQADEVLAAIADGRIDRTIVDAVAVRRLLASYPQLEVLQRFPAKPLAWALQKDAIGLQQRLDVFLTQRHLSAQSQDWALRDLDAIRTAGRLRMITVSGPHTYFLYKGELMGFDLELLQRFSDTQDLSVEVVVAADREEALRWLQEGRGDMLAAATTVTPRRLAAGWVFSSPYLRIDEYLVGADEKVLEVHTNPDSSHWDTAQALGLAVRAVEADTETLLQQVAVGEIPGTLADAHLLDVVLANGAEFATRAKVAEAQIAWVLREDQPQLRAALNAFIDKDYRGLGYNLLRQKYFGSERRIRKREPHRLDGPRLSAYDDALQALAAEHDFDWRLLVAQAYQESEFDPSQTSFAGARGLMQVMPRTARQLGVDPDELWQPNVGLEAGVRYLAWCRERFEDALPLSERTWFALAAYNAGPGHVRDARKLAGQLGLERDLWFGHVEQAMLKLSQREYARAAAHGYVRGREPVNYVREIRRRYQAYVDHLGEWETP